MTTFTDILGAIGQDATQPTGATKWSDLDKVFAEQAAATEPGATPGSSAAEQEAMAGAAKAYEDSLLIPEPPTAVKALTLGLNLREVERGLRTQVAQAAQAVATPGLRAKFIESVVNPMLAVAYPYMKPVNDLVIPEMAKAASMAMEPADSGLTTADLPTELLAARGAAQGMAAGQAEGIMADISRAVGQSLPQTAAVGATILTGGGAAPVVLSNLASQALIPFSAWTAGQLSYMDELDAVRAQEALEGRPLTQFDPDEMQRRGIASGAIQTGTEAIGAGIAGRAIGRIAARATALRPAKAVVGALAERGAPIVGRALATRGGQAAGQAFARATAGAMRFNKGFFGQAAKIVAISAAEEGAEELGAAILESPFTFAPLGDDLKQGIYSAFIGSVAGGAGGGAAVISTAARKGLVNRADAFRPENDREIALRQQHTEAMKARTNWTADLDETQQAEVAVALNSLNGMDPAQRGEYLRELADQRADIAAKVESLLALRQDLDAALAGAQSIEAEAALQAAQAERQAAEELQQEAEAARAVVRPRVQRPGRRAPTGAALEQQVTEAQTMAEQARAAEEAALARAVEVEVAPGVRVDPKQSAAEVRSMIEETDAELRMLVTDRLLADAKYGAVREKLSDLPMDFRQEEPAQVLSGLSASTGVSIAEAKAPKRGGRVQKELEALGMRVVWFKATGKPFGSPAFHTMSSRGTVYLNVDADMSHVRARAYEEMFHDIQMFRPDVAQAYSEAVGVESSYAAGEKYARGRPESRAKGVMDTFARIQAAAAEAGVAGEQVELPAPVSRIGAARLEQEGQANAFAEAAARVTGAGPLRALMRSAARRGLMGREVAGAMAVIDTVSRAAAVERVNGVKPVATLSPLARTLLWAEDMAVDLSAAVEQAVQPAPAPAPAAPGVSMARDLSTIWEVSVSPDIATFEEAHVGGIADLGNEDSKYLVSLIPDYESKIAGVRNAIRRVLGDSFKLYRSMSKAQLESWKNGEDVGPMSGTANRSLAERFVNLAAVRDKNRVIVEVDVTPEMIVLRGSENESELVFDANEISADQVRVVSAPAASGISMARASDAEYLAAVERGDMATAQRMVDAAAKAAGYTVGPVYHGTFAKFNEFDLYRATGNDLGFHFGDNAAAENRLFDLRQEQPQRFAKAEQRILRVRLRMENPLRLQETRRNAWQMKDVLAQIFDGDTVLPGFEQDLDAYLGDELESRVGGKLVSYADLSDNRADENEWLGNFLLDKGYDGIVYENRVEGGTSYIVYDPNRIKLADPVTRDEAGNVIPLSRRFDVSRPEISFARPQEDAETIALREKVSTLRAQADELRRQMRDVQNVTAAQRVNAMKEVRVLERRIVTAERLAEQKTLQATRAKMRLDLERQAAQEDIRAAEDVAAKMAVRLDEVQASVRSMRSELASLRRGERVEERLAQAEEESQRAIDFAYAIGRNEGLLAGEVRGQQVERRQVRKLSERLDVVQARLDKAIPALRESRAQIKDDAKAAQRAIDFAYGMGLAKGRLQGVMEGRRQVLARMARREDTLQNQLFNLRKTAEARAEAKESVQDAVRQIALDAARMLPERLRGPLATRIAQAKTLAQANRVAVEAVKVAANNEVAQSIDAIRTLRKRIGKRGMTYATRTAVERLLDDAESGLRTATGRRIRATVQTARGSAPALVNAVEVYAAVVDASAKVEQAVLMYDMDRQRYLALRAQRIARYDALRQRLAQDMSGRQTLSDRERADQPPGLPLARAVSRANSDIYTLMLELEGTEMGVIGEMLMEAQAGKGESSLEHATILRGLQPALQAAGYESIDAYALRNGLLGQSSAQVRDVTLGGRTVSLPVGTIISIAAMDDETLALFPDATNDGQSMTFRGAETTTLIRPSKAEIRALRSGLSAGERGLIDAMKNVLETQIRDRVMDAVFAVEGDQPPVVANYWPRVRLSKQKADASILNASAGTLVRGALTNVGFANARTGGTEPLVYDDAFKTWERHVQVALDMIHMAQPYRTAATVLTDPAVVEGMDRQMGQGTAERVLAIFSNGVGATARSNPTVIDKFTNNVTGAILAMRPKTLAKVLIGGQIRLASELPVGLLARGSARAARRLANPRAWDARVEEIHSLNGYFARRHQLHMRSIVSGSLSDADRVRVTTAFSAMIDGFRAAGQSIAAAQLTDALAGFRDASNGANMMIASVVDALRYMDEQIMLTAVEARLIEVEDEGIRTGQDALREAALRAERDFRRTQNASDEFDDVSFAAHARVKGQTGLRIFFPFSSDPLKARNQIRRAYLSGDRRLQTAGAIAGNAASSTIIGLASIATVGYIASLVSGILGGTGPEDEEEKKFMEQAKRLPASVSAEVLSSTLGYAGIIMGQVVQGMQYRRPLFAPLVGRPIEQAGRELTSADPWYARMVTSLLAISQYAGFPMYGLYQFVREQFEGAPAAKEKAKPEPKTPAERLRDRIERRRRELQNIGK